MITLSLQGGGFMSRLLIALLVLLSFSNVQAVKNVKADVLSLYKVTDLKTMPAITEKYEVVQKLNDGYEVIIPAKQTAQFLKLAPTAQLISQDIAAEQNQQRAARLMTESADQSALDYRTWDDIQKELKTLEQQYPTQAQVVEYGKSQQGRPLLALKISNNVQVDENEPEILLTAATHGDEVITTEVLLNLTHNLLEGSHNGDIRMANILAHRELFIVPVVNPDGFTSRLRYDNNVDPNRSYPYPKNPNAKPTAAIAGLISLFNAHHFVGSLDYHASGKLIMYPWAYTNDLIPESDYAPFDLLAKNMSVGNNYTYGPISHVIYIAQGSSADYYYWKNQTKAFAIEIGTSKEPLPSKISFYTTEQSEPLWKFIESF